MAEFDPSRNPFLKAMSSMKKEKSFERIDETGETVGYAVPESRREAIKKAAAAYVGDSAPIHGEDYLSMYTGDKILYDSENKEFYSKHTDLLTGKVSETIKYGKMKDVDGVDGLSRKLADTCDATKISKDAKICDTWFDAVMTNPSDAFNTAIFDAIKEVDFNALAVEKIKGVHPLVAVNTLRKFGFRRHLQFDTTAGTELWKTESCNHWIKHYLTKNHGTKEVQDMIQNPKSQNLLRYLSYLCQYVNASPAILNQNFVGKSDEAMGVFNVPVDAAKLGLKVPYPRIGNNVVEPCLGNLVTSKYVAIGGQNINGPSVMSGGGQKDIYGGQFLQGILSPFGTRTFTPGVPMLKNDAGDVSQCKIITNIKNQGSNIMIEMFKGIVKALDAKGKPLSEDQKNALNTKLEQHKQLETELLRTLCFLENSDSESLTRKIHDRYAKLFEKYHSMEKNILSELLAKDTYVPI